jgi:hypothetical protein
MSGALTYRARPSNLMDMPSTYMQSFSTPYHALRFVDGPRLVWADAICIDQTNNSERGHQVNIMGEIYRTARNVVVYLGKSTERTEEGMRSFKFFTEPNG